MRKQKNKPRHWSQDFIADLFSLQREFYFETEIEAEVLADKLNELGYQDELALSQFREGDKWTFELQSLQKGRRGGYAPTAKASGTIYSNEENLTVISGTARVGGAGMWLLIAIFILLALIMLPFVWMIDSALLKIALSITFLPPPIMLWFMMVSSRTMLLIALQQLMSPPIKEKSSYE